MKLCLDALSFLPVFWCVRASRSTTPWDELTAMTRRVACFVDAAEQSGHSVLAVIGAAGLPEDDWRRELADGDKELVLRVDVLLWEALRGRGVHVFRPRFDGMGVTATDVLAALAYAYDGAVVSQDPAFGRYRPRLQVYDRFGVEGGRLQLRRAAREPEPGPCREISLFDLVDGWREAPLNDAYGQLAVAFGVSSSSDRECGSLHVLSRRVRAAVYTQLGLRDSGVTEDVPEWDGAPRRTTAVVTVDDEHADMLQDPRAIWEHLLAASDLAPLAAEIRRWRLRERIFNMSVVAAELHVAVCGGALTAAVRRLEPLARARAPAPRPRAGAEAGPPFKRRRGRSAKHTLALPGAFAATLDGVRFDAPVTASALSKRRRGRSSAPSKRRRGRSSGRSNTKS